ncbi:MAG: hypothetical protein KF810_20250 [Rhizobiaceae bacterium]|nr:hypothetical protein [Rhizobiaceae bacterium]
MVNVTVVARDVRVLHPNMPLLEIEQAVLAFADLMGVPIVFDGGKAAPPVPEHLIVEFIGIDGKEIGDAPAHAHSLDGLDKVASDI